MRIEILDNGLIFLECKRLGRLVGPRGQEELADAANQLRVYIRAHADRTSTKPKTVLGVVTAGYGVSVLLVGGANVQSWVLRAQNSSHCFGSLRYRARS